MSLIGWLLLQTFDQLICFLNTFGSFISAIRALFRQCLDGKIECPQVVVRV